MAKRPPIVDRRGEVLREIRDAVELEVTELANRLGIPPATLRRDLRVLEAQGLVRRSYGIVAAVESSNYETTLAARASGGLDEHRAIADAAATVIGDASTIYIDEGVTPRLAAQRLPSDRVMTIITPSIPVAAELAIDSPHEVIMLGGRVRGVTLGTVDYWARDMLAGFVIDLAIMGANGVTVEEGLTTPDPAVAAVKSAAVKACRRVILVSDHTKFGVASFARFAGVSDVELFITGDRVPLSQSRRFALAGAQLIRV